MAEILDGTKLAFELRQEIKKEISDFGVCPKLVVFLVGNNPASELYVSKKVQAAKEVGIDAHIERFEENVSECELLSSICSFEKANGVLVQLPLPMHIDKFCVFDAICPNKDVDCFNPRNIGLVVQNRPYLLPCTPQAIVYLLHNSNIQVFGKKVVIINRSIVVGAPLANMLIQDGEFANATVTVCHEHTQYLEEITRNADIIVTAVGKREEFVLTADMVNENSVVVDVGITKIEGKTYGDVDFKSVFGKVRHISRVFGGVGPLTVAMLLKNTLIATKKQGVL